MSMVKYTLGTLFAYTLKIRKLPICNMQIRQYFECGLGNDMNFNGTILILPADPSYHGYPDACECF